MFDQYHLTYRIFFGSDEQSPHSQLYTASIAKKRMMCAIEIWKCWQNERHWGPRCGVILILYNKMDVAKVCVFCETFEIRKNLEYLFRFYWFHILKMVLNSSVFPKANLTLAKPLEMQLFVKWVYRSYLTFKHSLFIRV